METRATSARYISEQCEDAARLATAQGLFKLAELLILASQKAAEHFEDDDPTRLEGPPRSRCS
jgi:hypothetical protein